MANSLLKEVLNNSTEKQIFSDRNEEDNPTGGKEESPRRDKLFGDCYKSCRDTQNNDNRYGKIKLAKTTPSILSPRSPLSANPI